MEIICFKNESAIEGFSAMSADVFSNFLDSSG